MRIKYFILIFFLYTNLSYSQIGGQNEHVSVISDEKIDSICNLIIDSIVYDLKMNYDKEFSKKDLCIDDSFTDSIYYEVVCESQFHYKLIVPDTVNGGYMENPIYTNGEYDPNKKYKVYSYNEYRPVNHKETINVVSTNEKDCIAEIVFGQLYQEDSIIHSQIFVSWKQLDSILKRRRQIYAIQIDATDMNINKLLFGTIDDIYFWR